MPRGLDPYPLAAVVTLGEGISCYHGVSIGRHFYRCSSLLVRRKHNTVAFQVNFGHVCDFALFTIVIAIVVVVICC